MVLALILGGGISTLSASAYTKGGSTGVVVPLYTYPTDSSWSSLIKIKQSHPLVPIVAIINPSSGPGSSQDPNYVSGIHQLKGAGIVVLGYVHTSYGSRSVSVIQNEIRDYKIWYGVNGIFFDEMSGLGTKLSYYKSLADFANSEGFTMTMGNPGTVVASSLVGVFSNLCIYENPGMPSTHDIDGYMSFGKHGFSYIAYGVSGIPSQSEIKGTTTYVGYIYITNLRGSNPYNGLPAYLQSEVAALAP